MSDDATEYRTTPWRNPKNGVVYDVARPVPAWHQQLRQLHALGLNDGEIARALDRKASTVNKARRGMGLPRNADPGGPVRADVIDIAVD